MFFVCVFVEFVYGVEDGDGVFVWFGDLCECV